MTWFTHSLVSTGVRRTFVGFFLGASLLLLDLLAFSVCA
jgi:hypothetical protein